jgi:hypothetical protein
LNPREAPAATSGNVPATSEALRFLHERQREKRDVQDLLDRLYYVYCALLLLALAALLLSPLLEVPRRVGAAGIVPWIARLGPPALLVAFFAGLHYATWQGPVVFSRPDIRFLLASPLPRVRLVRGKLLWGLAGGVLLGGAAGLAAFGALSSLGGTETLSLLVACVVPFGAFGLLVAALGWHVERSAGLARTVTRARPLISLVVCASALALAFAPALLPRAVADATVGVALLSGPWGWTLAPLVALLLGGTTAAALWPVTVVLLSAVTILAVVWALATAGRAPIEELALRAELRRGLRASLVLTDFRGTALMGRGSGRRFGGVLPRTRLPRRPRRPLMAVPWRDALWAARNVGRVSTAAVLAGGALLVALAAPGSLLALFGAVVLAYLGASQLVETMRAELDAPGASRYLPYRYGDLVLLHALVPIALLTAAVALSCAVGALSGLLPVTVLPVAFALCPSASAALVACAAVAAQRSRTLPLEVMQAAVGLGDLGGFIVLQWYAVGPTLALVALGLPGLLLAISSNGAFPWGVLLGMAVYLSLFAAATFGLLRRRRFP